MNAFEIENRASQQRQAAQREAAKQQLVRIAQQSERPARKSISTAGGFTQLMLALMR